MGGLLVVLAHRLDHPVCPSLGMDLAPHREVVVVDEDGCQVALAAGNDDGGGLPLLQRAARTTWGETRNLVL